MGGGGVEGLNSRVSEVEGVNGLWGGWGWRDGELGNGLKMSTDATGDNRPGFVFFQAPGS